MKSLFGNRVGGHKAIQTPAQQILEKMEQQLAGQGPIMEKKTAAAGLAMEGFGEAFSADVDSALTQLNQIIYQATSLIKGYGELSVAQ